MKLKTWIKKNKLQFKEFAEKLEVSRQSVSLWISGRMTPMKIHQKKIKEFTGGQVSEEDWKK